MADEEDAPTGRARAVEQIRAACISMYGMTRDQVDDLIAKANEVTPMVLVKEELQRCFNEAVDVAETWVKENPEISIHSDFMIGGADAGAYYDITLGFLLDFDSVVCDQYYEQSERWFYEKVCDELRERGVLPKKP